MKDAKARPFQTSGRLEYLPEFRDGAIEFLQTIKECPICSIKLALELAGSDNPEDKNALKELLKGLGKTLLEQQKPKTILGAIDEKKFPLLSGWLKGEIGPGIIAKLFGRQGNED